MSEKQKTVLITGADVAAAVHYLPSDAASWVTGQTLPVNGGAYAI